MSTKKRPQYKDRNRRRRWITACNEAVEAGKISLSCLGWLMRIGERSDDHAKQVHGYQVNQAKKIRRCERSVRTYRKQAEEAGLIKTLRGKPVRNSDGTWKREHTNKYSMCVPKAKPNRAPKKKPQVTEEKPRSDAAATGCPVKSLSSREESKSLRDNHARIIDFNPDDDQPIENAPDTATLRMLLKKPVLVPAQKYDSCAAWRKIR